MAVKKSTAKKAVAKKSAAKKASPKKSTVKKATAKKSVTKKAAVKKSAAKKSTVKKSAAKSSVVKKATVKKATTRKSTARKASATSIAAKRIPETVVIPEAPLFTDRPARVEVVSTPAPAPIIVPSAVLAPPAAPKKQGASGRVIFAVVVGIILLALIVWARGNNSNSQSTATPTASATPSTAPTTPAPTPTPSETAMAITAHEAPVGVVAHYTSTGATIFWGAPSASDGLTGYNVEISISGGAWKLISTVPSTQMTLDITKDNSNGWTSFRVSSVYSDSQTAAAKAFGLPGTYS